MPIIILVSGLSDKPQEYDYTIVSHGKILGLLIEPLNLEKIMLVLHNLRGSKIGLEPKGEVFYKKIEPFLKSSLLLFLYKRINFSPRFLLPKMFSKNHLLFTEFKKHYIQPFKDSKERAKGF